MPLFLFTSCTDKEKKGPDIIINVQGPLMTLDSQDTLIVTEMATEFIEFLKGRDYKSAIAMLYYLDPDSALIPLPRNLAIRQEQIFRTFPVLDYKLEGIQFRTETDCQVKYRITFFEKDGPDDPRNNTTGLYLMPMRREGQWYLTVRDSSSPAGAASEIVN
jgi:hypothetical protein